MWKWMMLAAVVGCAGAGPATAPALSDADQKAIAEQLVDKRQGVRMAGVKKCEVAAGGAAGLTSKVVPLLEDEAAEVRAAAARALGAIGDHAALPYLVLVATSEKEKSAIREAAKAAIKKMGPVSPEEQEWAQKFRWYVRVGEGYREVPDGLPLNASHFLDEPPKVGGSATYELTISQNLKTRLLAELKVSDQGVMLYGLDTEGVIDGARMIVPIALIGQETYTTIAGARRTVFTAVPASVVKQGMSFDEYQKAKAWVAQHKAG